MSTRPLTGERGPFRAEHLREGDRYELSNGHAIYCTPAGREHAGRNLTGAAVLDSDPAVEWAGVDAGFTPEPGTMRAPDVAIAAPGPETGFIPGAPPLAVEYAGPGHDEVDLKVKLKELLNNGTRQVWVVYLIGPRRVEVHTPDAPPRRYGPGEVLTAPGILKNPVPVEALYDRDAGHRAVLRNLLQRAGYDGIDAIREEGLEQGLEQGREQQARTLGRQLHRRLGTLPAADGARIAALSLPRLEVLAEALLDFSSITDLADWLAREAAD